MPPMHVTTPLPCCKAVQNTPACAACVRGSLQHCMPPHLHDCDVLARRHSLLIEAQPLLHLVLELLTKRGGGCVHEAVDAGGDGALVGEVAGDAALVARLGAADEAAVEDEAVLGGVALGLEGTVCVCVAGQEGRGVMEGNKQTGLGEDASSIVVCVRCSAQAPCRCC